MTPSNPSSPSSPAPDQRPDLSSQRRPAGESSQRRPAGESSQRRPAGESSQRRPAGESTRQTVQDLEQTAAGQPARPAPQGAAPEIAVEDADLPSPPTVPRYLRSDRRAGPRPSAGGRAAKPFDARTATLTAQSAALVDALTRGFAEALAVAMRPVVAATVDQLIPMILSLGSVPDPEDQPVAADVATAHLAKADVEDIGETA